MLMKSTFFRCCISGILIPGMFSSCYFNSAGHIFDRISHKAEVRMSEGTAGSGASVMYDSVADSYYLTDMRYYRVGKPIKTQYSVFDDEEEAASKSVFRGYADFKIPKDYALYLMGRGKKPGSVEYVLPEKLSSTRKGQMDRYDIVNAPLSGNFTYTHKSENGFWLGLAGVFDWLCVDLPITCVENGIVISVFTLAALSGLEAASSSSSGGGYSGSGGGGDSSEEEYNRLQKERYEFNARVTAGGPPI